MALALSLFHLLFSESQDSMFDEPLAMTSRNTNRSDTRIVCHRYIPFNFFGFLEV